MNNLSHPEILELSKVRAPGNSVGRILLNWIFLFILFYSGWRFENYAIKFLVIVLVGIQQHALSLWLHEGSHWLFFKDKNINDRVTSLLLALPLFVDLNTYRQRHFIHHRSLGTPNDTKQVIFTSISGWKFIVFIVQCLVGVRFFQLAFSYLDKSEKSSKSSLGFLNLALLQGLFLLSFALFLDWKAYFIFWLLPFMTFFQLFAGLRAIIEHQPPNREIKHPYTGHLNANFLEKFLFARAGFHIHWAHHEYQWVPWFLIVKHFASPVESDGYFSRLFRLVKMA